MGRYDRLLGWLNARSENAVVLGFEEMEGILESSLPDSARRYPAFWSTGNYVGRLLDKIGWRASLRLSHETVEFRRNGTGVADLPFESDCRSGIGAVRLPEAADLVLVGCVKEKRSGSHPAKELYTSSLSRGRRARAEELGCPWFILSAKYGLVHPDQEIETYNLELKSLPVAERKAWSSRVLSDIAERCGSLVGKTIEIHAGAEYRDHGLIKGLAERGGTVAVPLSRLSLIDQLSWYRSRDRAAPARSMEDDAPPGHVTPSVNQADIRTVVQQLTSGFMEGAWDLSQRPGVPLAGWNALPEYWAADNIRKLGANDSQVRTFLTLVAALDRARDADQLWHSAANLYGQVRWVFDPKSVADSRLSDLRDELARFGVSRRYAPDTAAWRLISEALVNEKAPGSIRTAVIDGEGDAQALKHDLAATTEAGQSFFPFLSGPKVSAMWVRMLIAPGNASIKNADSIQVAVDVQVRKVSEYLGIADTKGLSLDTARPIIQRAWNAGAAIAIGPPGVAGTAAAVDPAVWFFGKWGCTYCERAGRRIPICELCKQCRFER